MSARPAGVVVVDDEPVARQGIGLLLSQRPDCRLLGACGDGASALLLLRELRPDVLLLDIQMPGLDGLGVARALGADPPYVIFVTAHDRFALQAFEVAARDYLLKPFSDARFHAALDRALAERRSARRSGWLDTFHVRGVRGTELVSAEDVDWIEGASYYACLHAGARTHLVRQPLAELEQLLDPARFLRVHRSAIVNRDRVRAVRHGAGEAAAVCLSDGTLVPVSRNRWPAVAAALGLPRASARS